MTLIKLMSQVLEKVHGLITSILEASINDEHIWFRNLLVGILNCALLDYKYVELGLKESIYLAAWGRRNLPQISIDFQ